MFVNQINNNQFGFRYYLDFDSKSVNAIFDKRNTPQTTTLDSSAKITWGGKDPEFYPSTCYLQYFRVYWDYLANTQDKMINLALMDTDGGGIFIILLFRIIY